MPTRNTSALDLRNLHHFLGPVVPRPTYQFSSDVESVGNGWGVDLQIRLNSTKPRLRGLYPLLDGNDVLHDEVFQFSHKRLPSRTFISATFSICLM